MFTLLPSTRTLTRGLLEEVDKRFPQVSRRAVSMTPLHLRISPRKRICSC